MFGSGLPVCAVGFNCISELVQHGVNGVIFHSREELTSQLITYLMPNSEATKTLDHLREGVTQTESQRLRWEANWDEAALPLLRSPALARSPRRGGLLCLATTFTGVVILGACVVMLW